ncbi:3-hydroxyacyl-[acyl-carrier-protein] dehydratase [Bryocella elongata]|uniref:3-hydroxyacyl-[acyl-carrier-protein] dehydratase FabZ n=1 Tax=Bryocella elongata TaxID=863522 RepID=A0A1H5XPD4_9BACT|nr:3-hydroxyacyl-ACP dehydratase FabZ [Bryocella elongata]SEG13493.1 3-hydroxyacyl-[acyl-carrier-protein] dehydratase [Bryocella elongata]
MSDTETTAVAEAPATETTPVVTPKQTLDITEIMAIIPHRYPFLLIDRVIEVEPRVRIVAIKNVSMNEPQFQGHFPDFPIMPGVMTIEAMAQAGAALMLTEYSQEDRADKLIFFTGIENARFRRPVTPGDQVRIEVKVIQWRSRAVKMEGSATVDGKVVCDATFSAQLVPRRREAAPATKSPTAE